MYDFGRTNSGKGQQRMYLPENNLVTTASTVWDLNQMQDEDRPHKLKTDKTHIKASKQSDSHTYLTLIFWSS
jgi:hypothetical protein